MDRQLNRLRAHLLGEVVTATEVTASCPACGHVLQDRGTRTRTLITDGDEEITLTRSYQTCPACGSGLSPP